MNSILSDIKIPYTQFINAKAEIVNTLPERTKDTSLLLKLYQTMSLVRTFDTKAIALQRTGKLGTYASSLGQEAISTAVGAAMHADDVLCPYYREYGAMLQRGVQMSEIYSYWGGSEAGNHYADQAHDLPISVPIGTQSLHAVGVARAIQIKKQNKVAVCFIGDGGTSKGDFYEALNMAAIWNSPVVFIINNNQWAISVSREQQSHAQTLAQKAIAAGFTGEQVDGNDVIAVHHVVSEAIERARSGKGPQLIEAITYRLCDHTTADDASRYRPDDEVKKAWEAEPISRLRQYMIAQGIWDQQKEKEMHNECVAQVDAAVQTYLNTPLQDLNSIFDYLYETLPKPLEEQRQMLMENAHD